MTKRTKDILGMVQTQDRLIQLGLTKFPKISAEMKD